MKEQQNKEDFMVWLKNQIPDTPEMEVIFQEEFERIERAFALKKAREGAEPETSESADARDVTLGGLQRNAALHIPQFEQRAEGK